MNKTTNSDHERINDSFTSVPEKKILIWLASRMPAWVTPDLLTAFGFLGSVTAFFGYLLTSHSPAFLWLASFGFIINWFGDSLDGNLARYRKIERPNYGYFVDHIIDAISVVLIIFGFGFSPYVRFDLALFGATAYLMLSVYAYLATKASGIFRISYFKLGPTELRILIIIANTIIFFTGNPTLSLGYLPGTITVYDLVLFCIASLALTMFLVFSIKTGSELARTDGVQLQRVKTVSKTRQPKTRNRHTRSGDAPLQSEYGK